MLVSQEKQIYEPQLFSSWRDLLSGSHLARHHSVSLGINNSQFRNESRLNVRPHHPSSEEAHETLYFVEVMSNLIAQNTQETELTRKFARISCEDLVNESPLVHLNRLITSSCPLLSEIKSVRAIDVVISNIHTPGLLLRRPSLKKRY